MENKRFWIGFGGYNKADRIVLDDLDYTCNLLGIRTSGVMENEEETPSSRIEVFTDTESVGYIRWIYKRIQEKVNRGA